MYYVMSKYGRFIKDKFDKVYFTGEILYQGNSLNEALKIKHHFGQNYEVYTSDDGNSYYKVVCSY